MKIGIFGKNINNEESAEFCFFLLDHLKNKGVEVIVDEDFLQILRKFKKGGLNHETFDHQSKSIQDCDFMMSLGGDGTLLETLTFIRDSGIPVLGINLGRLGFLANVSKNDFYYAIDELIKGAYFIDRRSVLYLETNQPLFDGMNFALNDFVIHKNDTSSMVTVHAYLNGEFLNSYWGDGLIVSTPTGSTGYSLSCGGPILFPQSGSFVVTPVSPHNLNVRPIIISDDSVLSFEVEGRSASFLVSLDSRYSSASYNLQMAIRKAPFTLNLVQLNNNSYLKTLRSKLHWGIDNRN